MFCIDTNFIIDLMKGKEDATQLASSIKLSEVIVTSITFYGVCLGELLVGRPLSEIREMKKNFQVIRLDEEHAEEAAKIQSQLIEKGEKIPALDALIAGVSRAEDATLITDDEHFKRVKGLDLRFYKTSRNQ